MKPRILVVIPTVTGRSVELNRCIESYTRAADPDVLDVTITVILNDDRPCGQAWNEGAQVAIEQGYDAIHLTADDLAAEPGALDAGWQWIAQDKSPAALIFTRDTPAAESHGLLWGGWLPEGTPTSMTRIPLIRAEWWQPIPPIHYWSDNAVSSVLEAQGVPMVCSLGFAFRHYWSEQRRRSGSDEVAQRERALWETFDREVKGR